MSALLIEVRVILLLLVVNGVFASTAMAVWVLPGRRSA